MEEIDIFLQELFEQGKEKGICPMEAYVRESEGLRIKAFHGEIDQYVVSEERGLAIRGSVHGKMGSAYIEKLEKGKISELLEIIMETSVYDEASEETMATGSQEKEAFGTAEVGLHAVPIKDKMDFVLALEKAAAEGNPKIKEVGYCLYEEVWESQRLVNTEGFDKKTESTYGTAYIEVVAEEKGDVKTGYSHFVGKDFSAFSPEKIAAGAVADAVGSLGGTPITSGSYEVILRNNVTAIMLEYYLPIFQGDRVQREMSLLKGCLQKSVGVSSLNIIENPILPNGAKSRLFDDEGVMTRAKYLVKDGVLSSFLHNKKSARKDGINSTGNGIRTSHKSSVGILPTNLYIEGGERSFDEMVEQMERGVLIIDVQGTHAGMDPVSGEFSLQSSGYLVENGKIIKPVHQITIAGNFYSLMKQITEIGNDLAFGIPYAGYIGAPSLKVNGITIGGI